MAGVVTRQFTRSQSPTWVECCYRCFHIDVESFCLHFLRNKVDWLLSDTMIGSLAFLYLLFFVCFVCFCCAFVLLLFVPSHPCVDGYITVFVTTGAGLNPVKVRNEHPAMIASVLHRNNPTMLPALYCIFLHSYWDLLNGESPGTKKSCMFDLDLPIQMLVFKIRSRLSITFFHWSSLYRYNPIMHHHERAPLFWCKKDHYVCRMLHLNSSCQEKS